MVVTHLSLKAKKGNNNKVITNVIIAVSPVWN